jgi:hypothetical protein
VCMPPPVIQTTLHIRRIVSYLEGWCAKKVSPLVAGRVSSTTGEAAASVGRVHSVGEDRGRFWPRPTQLSLEEGDAVLVHWATPHAAVR